MFKPGHYKLENFEQKIKTGHQILRGQRELAKRENPHCVSETLKQDSRAVNIYHKGTSHLCPPYVPPTRLQGYHKTLCYLYGIFQQTTICTPEGPTYTMRLFVYIQDSMLFEWDILADYDLYPRRSNVHLDSLFIFERQKLVPHLGICDTELVMYLSCLKSHLRPHICNTQR